MEEVFSAGKLAKQLNINKETIRYYEKIGLLAKPKKDTNGYRIYTREDLSKIKFILIIKSFGFSLSEINLIFKKIYDDMLGKDVDTIKSIVQKKIYEMNEKIMELEKVKMLLKRVNEDILCGDEITCHDLEVFWNK